MGCSGNLSLHLSSLLEAGIICGCRPDMPGGEGSNSPLPGPASSAHQYKAWKAGGAEPETPARTTGDRSARAQWPNHPRQASRCGARTPRGTPRRGASPASVYRARAAGAGPGARGGTLAQLINLISHDSYHLGQIVLLRRLLGAWPPPSGG